jgi:hypothetical protein
MVHLLGVVDGSTPLLSSSPRAPLQLITVGELSKLSGNRRWRQSVVGADGSCARAVRDWLAHNGRVIYSGYGNAATGDNGTIMTTRTLSHLRGGDWVVMVNPALPLGSALLDRRFAPTTEWTMSQPEYLEHHDAVRLANARDVAAIVEVAETVGFDQWTA